MGSAAWRRIKGEEREEVDSRPLLTTARSTAEGKTPALVDDEAMTRTAVPVGRWVWRGVRDGRLVRGSVWALFNYNLPPTSSRAETNRQTHDAKIKGNQHK